MNNNQTVTQYDEWITDGSPFAALVMREWLVPVEGNDAVTFPPTYAAPEGLRKEDWIGYNIDRLDDGTKVCQMDSVGAQANRMEPIFKRPEYASLVPQITIQAGQRTVNLLDAGHRAADAIVRFSSLQRDLDSAFRAYQNNGDAQPLAKIAPTSIVFGSWDSRSTQAKLPRIIRSVIRAYQVEPLHRSAQYIPVLDYVADGILDAPEGKQQQDAMSELGLSHAPAAWSHGGILSRGGIRRDAALNLAALRVLGIARAKDENDDGASIRLVNLRRYVLGLALVCFTAPAETFLREGCQLVPDTTRAAEWTLVKHDGTRSQRRIVHQDAMAFASAVATAFGVGEPRQGTFNTGDARTSLGQTGEERKAARRRGRAATAQQPTAAQQPEKP
jgi:CRISPR-associated protein Csb1